jgi:hypothetical protein
LQCCLARPGLAKVDDQVALGDLVSGKLIVCLLCSVDE